MKLLQLAGLFALAMLGGCAGSRFDIEVGDAEGHSLRLGYTLPTKYGK